MPQRMCISCRKKGEKKSFSRIVRSPEGAIHVDVTGSAEGRGASLCKTEKCLQKALYRKGRDAVSHALQQTLSATEKKELIQSLSDIEKK